MGYASRSQVDIAHAPAAVDDSSAKRDKIAGDAAMPMRREFMMLSACDV